MVEETKEIKATFGLAVQFFSDGQNQFPIQFDKLTIEHLKQVIPILEEISNQLKEKVAEKDSENRKELADKIKVIFSQIK